MCRVPAIGYSTSTVSHSTPHRRFSRWEGWLQMANCPGLKRPVSCVERRVACLGPGAAARDSRLAGCIYQLGQNRGVARKGTGVPRGLPAGCARPCGQPAFVQSGTPGWCRTAIASSVSRPRRHRKDQDRRLEPPPSWIPTSESRPPDPSSAPRLGRVRPSLQRRYHRRVDPTTLMTVSLSNLPHTVQRSSPAGFISAGVDPYVPLGSTGAFTAGSI